MYDHRWPQHTHFIWVTLWQFLYSRKLSRIYREGPPLKRGRWKGSFQGRSGKEGELTCLDDVVQLRLEHLVRLESSKRHLSLYVFVAIQLLNHIWLCDPMNCDTPGFPVLHYLLEFAQIYIHWGSLPQYSLVFPRIAQGISPAPGKHWSTLGLCGFACVRHFILMESYTFVSGFFCVV